MPSTAPLRLLFSDYYDSVRQRQRRDSMESMLRGAVGRPLDLIRVMDLARMRLDVILCGQLVVTDAQLLDGTLLLAPHPGRLLDQVSLDGTVPLRVACRAPTLDESLRGLVVSADGGRLKSFEFSSLLKPSHAAAVSAVLAANDRTVQRRVARTSGGVAALRVVLEQAGVPADGVDLMARRWTAWTTVADQVGALPCIQWDAARFDLSGAVQLAQAEGTTFDIVDASLSTGRGHDALEVLARVLAAPEEPSDITRSGLRARVASTGDRTASESEPGAALDEQVLFELIDRFFGLAFTVQHGATDYDSPETPIFQPLGRGNRDVHPDHMAGGELLAEIDRLGLTAVEVPSDFLLRLGLADVSDLRAWHDAHAQDLRLWYQGERKAVRGFQRAIGTLEHVLATSVPPTKISRRLGMAVDPRRQAGKRRRARLLQRVYRFVGPLVPAPIAVVSEGAGTGAEAFAQRYLSNAAMITSGISHSTTDARR